MSEAGHAAEPAEIAVQSKRRISFVWLIPIIAVAIAGFLAYTTISEKGPEITIDFKTAEGLEAGKTKVKFKEVDIGQVSTVTLKPDLSGVVVTASLSKAVEPHLTDKTRFWVVRPRLGAGGVSGLGTLVSGAYVEMDPGGAGAATDHYVGLEEPPLVRAQTPGRRFVLTADKLGSFGQGSPVYYRGFKAGQVLASNLAEDNKSVIIHVFVDEPYDVLVRENSRFWDMSGVNLSIDANGMDLRTDSLEALILGGIAFETPDNLESGQAAPEDTQFVLFNSRDAIVEAGYVEKQHVIAYFDGSVRGLSAGAPVELRGIQIGKVVDVKMEFDRDTLDFRIPVLMELEPQRVSVSGAPPKDPDKQMAALIERGLRAQLQSGSLLTGQLLVALDLHPETEVRLVGEDDRYPEIPTIPSQLEEITGSVTDVLDRIAKLPIEQLVDDLRQTVQGANQLVASPETKGAIDNLNQALADAKTLLAVLGKDVGPLVASLQRTSDEASKTLEEAQATLQSMEAMTGRKSQVRYDLNVLMQELTNAARSIRVLTDYLADHPEALLRGKSGAE